MPAPTDHRHAAEQALVNAQRNPVLSAEQSFLAANAHALLAIEQRLGQLLEHRDSSSNGTRPLKSTRLRTARAG